MSFWWWGYAKMMEAIVQEEVELPLKYKTATGVTDIQTSSVDAVDMADMTLTVTVGANPVLILAHIPILFIDNSPFNIAYVFLVIDGEGKAGFTISSDMTQANIGSLAWLEALSAGEHTIKIQWWVGWNNYPVYQLGESGYPRQLIVIELVDAEELA